MDTLILTLQLFTSLPIRRNVAVSDERLIRGVALWPVAGILIGLFDVVVFWLASQILPRSVCGALVLLAELWMTRGFHLDGLCDTADAGNYEGQPYWDLRSGCRHRRSGLEISADYSHGNSCIYDSGSAGSGKDGSGNMYVPGEISQRKGSWEKLYWKSASEYYSYFDCFRDAMDRSLSCCGRTKAGDRGFWPGFMWSAGLVI